MPKYRNDTKKRIDWWGEVWLPNAEHVLTYFIPYKMLGLTKVDDEPYVLRDTAKMGYGYLEIQASAKPFLYDLPYSESVEISVYFTGGDTGQVKLFIGDNDIPIIITENNNFVSHYAWALSGYITIVTDGDVIPVTITVEPYTGRGTEKGRHN